MPAWKMSSGAQFVMSRPAKCIDPAVGLNWPVIMQMRVVLPAPFGPSRTRNSFSSILKSKLLRIVKPDARAVRPLTSRRLAIPLFPSLPGAPLTYGFFRRRRTTGAPIKLPVMRLLIRFLDDLTERRALPLFAHPVPNRTNDAVAHH